MVYVEILIVVVLIVVNGLLAMAELAIVSSRRARLNSLAERDVKGARRALALAADPGKFLSTVQIGITLVGVLSGAFSGATLGLRLTQWMASVGVPEGAADALGVGLVVAAITYASLIAGELVPKQIALRDPERIAVRVAPAMTLLSKVASPLVAVLDISGRGLLRLLGHQQQPEAQVSNEEIRALVAEAETAGVLEPGERAMITGVMRLGNRPVRAVMVPRRDVEMVDIATGPDAVRAKIMESMHSRLPVYEKTTENMLGVLQAKDLLNAAMHGGLPDIRAFIRQAPIIPDSADALDVVDAIKQSAVHIALIVDEYGHFEGIVTNADILETIVGEFRTEDGEPEPDAVLRDDGSWLISGVMAADEMAEKLAVPLPEKRGYHTAAGFVVSHMGRLPAVGESFDTSGWRFEVVDIDDRRVDKILVSKLARGPRRVVL